MRTIPLVLLACATAVPSVADAQETAAARLDLSPAPAPPTLTANIDWYRRPDAATLSSVFPMRAAEQMVSGGVRLRCSVEDRGFVSDCYVVAETPLGFGFGAAALRASREFRMRSLDGQPIRGRPSVVVPLVFGVVDESGRASQPAARPVMARPVWTAAPTAAQLSSTGAAGRARLLCRVTGDLLQHCITPEADSAATGAAARALADRFRVAVPAELEAHRPFDAQLMIDFSPAPELLVRPPWAATPTGGEVQAALEPLAVAQADRTARATLECVVGDAGALHECAAADAAPAAAGPALLALAPRFRVGAWAEEGRPTAGRRVRVPLRYVAD